jgi:(1->4)-alpha-D-glucan 1-alpha-D-glucosylmutase
MVTRLSERLAARGGWGAAELQLPPGKWLDLLTGRRVDAGSSGAVRLTELLPTLPVALIVPDERA